MSRWFLIIDGYNLMHAWGLARQRYGPGDLERLRDRFLHQLANRLPESQRDRTTVVFDAGVGSPTDFPRQALFEKMKIVFAQGDEDADTRIERLIKEHSSPRQIRLISSDRRLRSAARRRRGQSLTSEDFVAELEKHRDSNRPEALSHDLESKLTSQLSETEMAEWLRIFGEIEG